MKVPVTMIRAVLHVELHIECRLEDCQFIHRPKTLLTVSQLPLYETVRGARV